MPRKAKILTTDIHLVFRGLKFESDTGIGQKGVLFKGLHQDKVAELPGRYSTFLSCIFRGENPKGFLAELTEITEFYFFLFRQQPEKQRYRLSQRPLRTL
jgi:hypothetical protein